MRISVDTMIWIDPRFSLLAADLGVNKFDAIGRCLIVWSNCYDRRSVRCSVRLADAIADMPGFAAAMVRSDLATFADDGEIEIRGVLERIEFLKEQKKRGAAGGRKAAENRRLGSSGYSAGTADAVAPGSTTLKPISGSGSGFGSGSVSGSGGMQGGEPPRAVALTPTSDKPVKTRTKRAKAPETPLPAGWAPNAAHREQAARLGVDPEREAGRYRDHAEAHGRRLVSWDAGFRTWLSRAAEFQGRGANVAPALERPRTYGQHPTGQWGESPGVPADLFSGPIEEGPKTAPKRPADSAVRHLATPDTIPARGGPQVRPGGHVRDTAEAGPKS